MSPAFLIALAKTIETLAYNAPGMEVLDISVTRQPHPVTREEVAVAHLCITQLAALTTKGGEQE